VPHVEDEDGATAILEVTGSAQPEQMEIAGVAGPPTPSHDVAPEAWARIDAEIIQNATKHNKTHKQTQ
jgi:hypothetical protein